MKTDHPIHAIKQRLTVHDLWTRLFPQSAPKSTRNFVYHSPFRRDRNASFSLFNGGRSFKDHATNDGGDVIDFACLAFGCSKKEAVKRLADDVMPLPVKPASTTPKKLAVDQAELRRLTKQVLGDFKLEPCSVITRFLAAKGIDPKVAIALNKEGSLGCYYGAPAYVWPTGIKVRHSAESSRSTRWLIGNADSTPWRFNTLTARISTILLTEGESDALLSMSLMRRNSGNVRVLAAPGTSWRPSDEAVDKIATGRNVVLAFDNDPAGKVFANRLSPLFLSSSEMLRLFPWIIFPSAKDLCDISPRSKLAEILEALL